MATAFRWWDSPSGKLGRLGQNYADAIHQAIYAIVQFWEPQIEDWMTENAPWTDRTGNARQGLHADVTEMVGQFVKLWVGHGVDYGTYLELKNAGRYAIVNPALDHFAPQIWDHVRRVIKA